jgi:acetyl-CoA carboxylase biotin carboxyl carrier protein
MLLITSTMAGTILQINISVGDQVENNQEIAILESMKMEIPVESQEAGRVKEIKVAEGDFVNEGDVLIVLE